MRVLVACEFSGIVRDAFAERGHDAWSCDLLPSIRPGNHIQGDVMNVLHLGWDLMVAHPPCTHLAVCGAPSFHEKRKDGSQDKAVNFFMRLADCHYIPRIATENPVSIISSLWRKPNQILQPYFFGDPETKKICLWLKNLPPLYWLEFHAAEPICKVFRSKKNKTGFSNYSLAHERPKSERSVFFPGVAKAMAEQWG